MRIQKFMDDEHDELVFRAAAASIAIVVVVTAAAAADAPPEALAGSTKPG